MVFDRLSDFRYSVPIPIRYSDIYKSSLRVAHSVKGAISAFLKRRLAQMCCNFFRSCCFLCLKISFECYAYLSAWRSDAAHVNSRFTGIFTRKYHVPSTDYRYG